MGPTPYSRYVFGTLPWYSVLILMGICLALWLATREERRLGLPRDTVVDLALWLIPAGIVGARVYYVLFAWDVFRDNPVSVLYVWQGGLAIYGAILAGIAAALAFSRKRKLALGTLTDLIVPGLALAQALGRWGNYFNMEAYGLTVTDPAWQFFPFAVLIPGSEGGVWHMATFFYESVWDFSVFAALMLLRRRTLRRGDLTLWYVLLYGGGRLIVEGLRLDSLMTTGGSARVSQLLSVALCMGVTGLFAWRTLRMTGSRALLPAAVLAVCAVAATLLLPRPVPAFLGYEAAWCVLSALAAGIGAALLCGAASAVRRLVGALPPLCVALTAGVRCGFASAGISGAEASTTLCLLLTLTCLTAAGTVYPRLTRASAADAAAR